MEGHLQKLRASIRTSLERSQKTWKLFWSEDWYFALNKAQTITIILLVLLLAGGSGILFLRRQPGKTVIKEVITKPPETKLSGGEAKTSKSVVVHICGAVCNPGVYELSADERVNDAIAQAGGGAAEANLDALNLAAKLTDGQRIYVPKIGETPALALSPSGNSSESGFPVSLNTATPEQLDTLPGIGETLAKRILEYRQAHGGFKKVSELQNIGGIGEKKYNQLKDKVTVE